MVSSFSWNVGWAATINSMTHGWRFRGPLCNILNPSSPLWLKIQGRKSQRLPPFRKQKGNFYGKGLIRVGDTIAWVGLILQAGVLGWCHIEIILDNDLTLDYNFFSVQKRCVMTFQPTIIGWAESYIFQPPICSNFSTGFMLSEYTVQILGHIQKDLHQPLLCAYQRPIDLFHCGFVTSHWATSWIANLAM